MSLCLAAMLIPEAYGQSIPFSDGFSDGNFDRNPTWSGADSLFKIVDTPANNLLQLDAGSDDDGDAYLSTRSTQISGSWEFYLNMDFAPSGSNYALIYLMSDRADLDGPVNGYAIRAGERGSDDRLRLIRLDSGNEVRALISGQLPIGAGGGYRIKVNRSDLGEWTLQEAKGYNGLPSSESDPQTDITHTAVSHLGIRTLFTSTRSDKFSFDFKITFKALAIRQLTDSKIEMVFSTALKRSNIDKAAFTLSEAGSPSNITFQSDSVVHLEFDNPIRGGTYILQINNIEGSRGQQFEGPSSLKVSIFDTILAGDIVINELLPIPPTGMPEYIELWNQSDKTINLQNWTINDSNRKPVIISDEQTMVQSGGFIVLVPETTQHPLFDHARQLEVKSLPILNNSGDDVVLRNKGAVLMDSLSYSSEWLTDEISIERLSGELASHYADNWKPSRAEGAGTPGAVNSQMPDTTSPTLISLQIADSTTFRLIFSETLKPDFTTDLNNITITPPLPTNRLLHRGDTIDIVLDQAMRPQTEYLITVSLVEDLFGNLSPPMQGFATYYGFTQPAPVDIVINEFLYKGEPEFVELYNKSKKTINIKGWSLADRNGYAGLAKQSTTSGSPITIQSSIPILPDSYVVLTGSSDLASGLQNAHYLKNFPSLNNSDESISIHDESHTTIDSLYYNSELWNTKQNQSLERKDPGAASADPSNWTPSPDNSTPGKQNLNYEIDTEPPDITIAHILPDSTIEVVFSEFITYHPDSCKLTNNGRELSIISFNEDTADRLIVRPPENIVTNRNSNLFIEGILDIRGNSSPQLSTPIAWPIEPGGIIINEILADPLSDNTDHLPDQAEYIEIYNGNDYAVSLEGIYLHDEPDENRVTRDLYPVSTQAKWLPALSHAIIHASIETDIVQSPVIRFFNLSSLADSRNMVINRSSLSLKQKQDAIYLADSSGTTIDSVFYHTNWHNTNLIDTKGISMERITPGPPSNDARNWSSSTHNLGGTPAAPNSIFMKPGATNDENSIIFSPNPFSPDGDGHEDHVGISYRLDAPDYLLRIRIFDRYGRLVRKLTDAKQAGPEGKLIWEGRNEQGNNLRIGIYIVLFEAYNSSTGQDRTFKKSVVIARKL